MPRRRRPGAYPAVVACVLAVSLLSLSLTLCATWDNSPTVDEFAHLPAGVYYWRTGDLTLYDLNPPLSKLVASLPALSFGPELDVSPELIRSARADAWGVGYLFFRRNGADYDAMLFWSRVPIALCGAVVVGMVCFWSWELFGWAGGVISGLAGALCPTLLAHGGLVTPDVPLTLFWLLTLFFVWKTAVKARWYWTLAAGVCLGLALLTKYSALVLLVSLPLTMVLVVVLGRRPDGGDGNEKPGRNWKPLWHVLAAVGLAFVVAGVPYGFEGFGGFAGFRAQSRTLKTVSWLPLPLARGYVHGLDAQLVNVEKGEFTSYVNGECYKGGRWYYFPEAFALKVPTPTLGLIVLALAVGAPALRRPGPAFLVLTVPAVLFLLVNMFMSQLNVGIRYILPVFPCFLVGLGVLGRPGGWFRARIGVAGALVAVLLVVVVGNCPHYLAYFNRIAGGRPGGARYLLDSNIDWGQDLKRLGTFLKERDVKSVHLAYFGYIELSHYGVEVEEEPVTEESTGWVAVSTHYLYGMPYGRYGADEFAWLRGRKPVANIGGSIAVYDLGEGED